MEILQSVHGDTLLYIDFVGQSSTLKKEKNIRFIELFYQFMALVRAV